MVKQVQRTTFEMSRAAEYFDARQLSTLTGVSRKEFASVCLKELVDNALDAAETAGLPPEVNIEVERDNGAIALTVSDNGPGIPPEVVRKVLDYNVRVSDKAAYRSPTRGAQGNALKTLIGIPYALGSREPLVVEARGVRHSIAPRVDPAGIVHFDYAATSLPIRVAGTTVSLSIPDLEEDRQRFSSAHWVSSFAAFNPHATIVYQGKTSDGKGSIFYKRRHQDTFKKYVPSVPTSPHWYSPATLKGLVFNHIAHARKGGRDLPLGEFIRQFQGLTSTKKARAVVARLGASDFSHLSGFENHEGHVAELLSAMQAEAKVPNASALGSVGREHFKAFFEHTYSSVDEYKYVSRSGTLPSGLPFTFEFALVTLDQPGHLFCGVNFSPTFGDPLAGTTLTGPEFEAQGLYSFLGMGHALPQSDSAWHYTRASVAVATHIVTPAPLFLDRGKTRLDMEGA
jgi:DNA topoisomerase VI subunit B